MSTFDVRNDSSAPTELRMHDKNRDYYIVELMREGDYSNVVKMFDSANDDRCLSVIGKEHAENVIKGLQKAIDLGWLK